MEAIPAAQPPSPEGLQDLVHSDQFRMDYFKVLPCTKHYVHDWTECPFAHPQEKARRRDPRHYQYTGIACPSMKQGGSCSFGDNCPYAHNVFEYWLHPTRYRTQLCNDGASCTRKTCFFAHSLVELRTPSAKPFVHADALVEAAAAAAATSREVGQPSAAAAAAFLGQQQVQQRPAAAQQQQQQAAQQAPQQAQQQVPRPTRSSAPSSQSAPEHPLLDVMTKLVARGKVSAEQSAAILKQVLSPEALSSLQAEQDGGSYGADWAGKPQRHSDPLGQASHSASSMETAAAAAAAAAASIRRVPRSTGVAAAGMYTDCGGYGDDCGWSCAAAPGMQQQQGQEQETAFGLQARMAALQQTLQQAQALGLLGLPSSAAGMVRAPAGTASEGDAAGSARSSLDAARASLDSILLSSLCATPEFGWPAGYAAAQAPLQEQQLVGALRAQQLLPLGSLPELQEAAEPQWAATAAAAASAWAAAGAGQGRASLDSQLSIASRMSLGGRPSLEGRMSLGGRPSMDSRHSMEYSRHSMEHSMDGCPSQPDFARLSLEETAAPRVNPFTSSFFTPGAATPAYIPAPAPAATAVPHGHSAGTPTAAGAAGMGNSNAGGMPPSEVQFAAPLLHPRPVRYSAGS